MQQAQETFDQLPDPQPCPSIIFTHETPWQELKNRLSAEFELAQKRAEVEQIALMQVIMPIDDEEYWLGFEIEFLNNIYELLSSHIQGTIPDLVTLHFRFMQMLDQTVDIFCKGYQTRLKSRPYYFDRETETFIKLDQNNIATYVADLRRNIPNRLGFDQWNQKIQEINLNEIISLDTFLQQEIQNKRKHHESLIDRKTPYGMRYSILEENLLIIKSKHLKQQQDFQQNLQQDLAHLCFLGDLDKIRELFARASSSSSLFKKPTIANSYNKDKQLPLHRACEAGHQSVINYLLKKNANPKLLDKGPAELSAYHYAAMNPDPTILQLLLDAGTKEDLQILGKHNRTILHSAAFAGADRVVTMIAAIGAVDLNAKDTFIGSTALHLAAWKGYASTVRVLLACGADPYQTDNNGENVLVTAILYYRTATVYELFRAGYLLNEQAMQILTRAIVQNQKIRPQNNLLFYRCINLALNQYQQTFKNYLLPSIASEHQSTVVDVPKAPDLPASLILTG
jgi:ankyrin repeat protein